ncbi:WG repeat-containing protein [Paenibacillus sp. DMB5]|uniref:WG repeat-containing protein n=1 Tax=Paenibacillus sp. DMB5 TaxID=1780103 RepID=UPI000FE141E1|nr:WG repeat-containing protein [Paenibacillus sp. DMB5]
MKRGTVFVLLSFSLLATLMFGVTPQASAGIGSGSTYTPDAKYLPYTEVGPMSEGLASYFELGSEIDTYGFINSSGTVVIKAKYQAVGDFKEGFAAVMLDNKCGFINKTGVVKIPLKYEKAGNFGEGLVSVMISGKFGYIDTSGKLSIKAQYDQAGTFHDGLAPVQKNGKWGYINKTGKVIIPLSYESVYSFNDTYAAVKQSGKWGFIDKKGKSVIKPQYSEVRPFSEGLAAVKTNNLWGFIDTKGTIKIKPQYIDVHSNFSEGLAVVSKKAETASSYAGYIDKTGKEVLGFEIDEDGYENDGYMGTAFSNGLAVISDGGQGAFYIVKNPLKSQNNSKK